jgi:hypothetical protein
MATSASTGLQCYCGRGCLQWRFAVAGARCLEPTNEQLLGGEAHPLVRREDGLVNSLARLKPRIETGSGKGNPKNRAKKQRLEQENVPPAAEIIAKPTAPRPRNMAHQLELAIEKEARRKGRQPGPSFSAQPSQGGQPCPLTADPEPAMMLQGVRVPAHN